MTPHAIVQGIAIILVGMSVAGLVFHLAAVHQVRRFMLAHRVKPRARPGLSILKPLCGAEPSLPDNLASFCRQDYPDIQLVVGVSNPADPALGAVGETQVENPDSDIAIVVDERQHGRNLKVGNLINMLPQAKHPIIAIADSDVHVTPGYADDVAAPFDDPKVGLVTCLYIGRPVQGFWSRIGALGVNHGFLPAALVARAIGRKDGCFGATMALRREVLEEIGGFAPLQDMLADDWALGAAVRATGREIALAARPVEIIVNEPDFKTLFAHEIRWGRTIAAVDRLSYISSIITQPVALAAVAALIGQALPYTLLVIAAALLRLGVIRAEETALSLPRTGVGMLALREILTFVVFIVAVCGRSVVWRGRRFYVRPDGTLELREGSL